MVKFIQDFIDESKYEVKSPFTMNAKYITVHNTYNDASAKNEIAYMKRNNNQVSYHVAIDDKEIIQAIPFNRNAWHCGDGNGNGNRFSIGIEICYSKSGGKVYQQAEENTVNYIAQLLHQFDWDISRVKKHEDWSGKYCPHRILHEGRWWGFIKRIQTRLAELKNPKKEVIEVGSFKDTPKTHYAYKEIERAKELGLMNGIGNDLFKPDGQVTRAELAIVVTRLYDKLKG